MKYLTIENVLTRFDGVTRCHDNQYTAKCPAHDDKNASLSVSVGKNGKTLLHCHAGCNIKDICSAIGIKESDLFPDQLKPPERKKRTVVSQYRYTDIDGNLLNQKTRWMDSNEDKSFTWSHKENGRWIRGHNGDPVLYNMPVLKNYNDIYVVEGEKDVDSLSKLGLAAVCGAHGAGHDKWLPQYTAALRGKNVFVIQDNDDIGKAFAVETCNALTDNAASVKLIDLTKEWTGLKNHGDISDVMELEEPKTAIDKLQRLVSETEQFQPIEQCDLSNNEPGGEQDNAEKRLTIETAKQALQELGITIRYNLLLKEPEVSGLPECYSSENAVNVLPIYLMDYLKSCGYKGVSIQTIDGCLSCISDQNRYNPVAEFLKSQEWDNTDRLQEIYSILGVTIPKYQTYIKKWLIQCIALGLNDENNAIGAEGVLVLQGEQGLAKTSFFRMLSPFPRWFVAGAVIDLKDKDTVIKALSGWLTELGELDSSLKREQSSLKAFITSPEDRIRPPYARNQTRTPRRTSFCGTVNPQDYLRDETGSRRFWTIPIEHIDKKTLFSLSHEWVTQLWAQIYVMYQQNKNGFRLTSEEMKTLQNDNQEFSIPLDYETEIKEMLDYDLPIEQWEWWKASDIADRIGYKVDARKVGKALARVEKGLNPPNPPNPPNLPKTVRTFHGITEYFLPITRFIKYEGVEGGTRVEQISS